MLESTIIDWLDSGISTTTNLTDIGKSDCGVLITNLTNPTSRRNRLLMEIRFWWYQELCLIHFELRQRYHFRAEDLVKCFKDGMLHWQFCWFELSTINPRIKSLLLLLLEAVGIHKSFE